MASVLSLALLHIEQCTNHTQGSRVLFFYCKRSLQDKCIDWDAVYSCQNTLTIMT